MVEQRNSFSNKFDDFQTLIEESKNQSLMAIQRFERLEAQMVEQDKVWVDQTKAREEQAKAMAKQANAIVKNKKQKTQSQVKLLEKISRVMGEARQHKQKVASGPTKKPYDELRGQYLGNSHEAGEFHLSLVQVDNPICVTSGSPNTVDELKSHLFLVHFSVLFSSKNE